MVPRVLVALLAVFALVLATAAKPRAPADTPPSPSVPPSIEDGGDVAHPAPEAPPAKRIVRAAPAGACPGGMVYVEGDECSEVEEPCLEWATELPGTEVMRCLHFGPSRCTGKLTHERFCIDRYEYPNTKGALPWVMKSWEQATSSCTARARRLCTGSEWTLACEGEERLPYPYGFDRDPSACNIDRPLSGPFPRWVERQPRGVDVSLVDWRAPSGEMDRCVSPYGVHDMTGNVDEWVVNETGHPYASGLKGGYWGPVRDRCRPMTVAHDEKFTFYQIGFRCCADAAAPHRAQGR
jgi:sulfatase modifying factor 1